MWWRRAGETGVEQRPHAYRSYRGHAWRWNPGDAGTGVWCVMLLRPLDGGETVARSTLGGVALDAQCYVRTKYLEVSDGLHKQSEQVTRLWLTRPGGAALRSLALYAPLETERLALREGLDWPLHLALACEQLRGCCEHGQRVYKLGGAMLAYRFDDLLRRHLWTGSYHGVDVVVRVDTLLFRFGDSAPIFGWSLFCNRSLVAQSNVWSSTVLSELPPSWSDVLRDAFTFLRAWYAENVGPIGETR